MEDTTYNGWVNRETWAANLWLSNSEYCYNELNDRIRGEMSEDSTSEEIISLFSNFAKDNLSEKALEEIGDFSKVDWLELGQMWIDEVDLGEPHCNCDCGCDVPLDWGQCVDCGDGTHQNNNDLETYK